MRLKDTFTRFKIQDTRLKTEVLLSSSGFVFAVCRKGIECITATYWNGRNTNIFTTTMEIFTDNERRMNLIYK